MKEKLPKDTMKLFSGDCDIFKEFAEDGEMFDQHIPLLVREGIPRKFIDDNIVICRYIFMMSQVFSLMSPIPGNVKKTLDDEEALSDLYAIFASNMLGPGIRKDIKVDVDNIHLRHIFKKGLMEG